MTDINLNGEEAVERPGGSVVVPVVYLDSDGQVILKTTLQPDKTYQLSDSVDSWFNVTGADLTDKLSASPANLPDNVPFDPPGNAWEKLQNVAKDDRHRSE